jgi:hypothetical protein
MGYGTIKYLSIERPSNRSAAINRSSNWYFRSFDVILRKEHTFTWKFRIYLLFRRYVSFCDSHRAVGHFVKLAIQWLTESGKSEGRHGLIMSHWDPSISDSETQYTFVFCNLEFLMKTLELPGYLQDYRSLFESHSGRARSGDILSSHDDLQILVRV